jgi:hypothetical protein
MLLAATASGVRGDEESAVASLQKIYATITRDENQPGKPVVGVSLGGRGVRDADLQELAALKQLRSLTIRAPRMTAA